MLCGDASIRATSHYGEVIAPIKCRSWLCENCAPLRQGQLESRCIHGKPNRFVTITCRRGQFETKEEAAAAISAAWRTVVLRWRRKQKWHKAEYICVFEPHKSGWPHLHILWKGHWIDWSWLSEQMTMLLNSPIVHISAINSAKQAAFYVAKYFSKNPEKFGNSKRYWTSKNWPKAHDTDAPRAFPETIECNMVPTRCIDLVKSWFRESKEVWHIKSRVFGWGELVDETTGEVHPRPPDAQIYEFHAAFDDG